MAGLFPALAILTAVVFAPLAAASSARAQDTDAGAPDAPAPATPAAPIGPPPAPPDDQATEDEQPSYPLYPGQPAPGYDATVAAGGGVDVVPIGVAPPTPTDERDHRGFFLRPHVGFGYLTGGGQGNELRGLAFSAGVMVGAAVLKNFIVFGEFAFQIVAGGEYAGPILPVTGEDTGLQAAIFGGGVAYYIMPFNVHASLSANFLAMQITIGDRAILPEPTGFAMHLALGKEWYVTRRLGLGIEAQAVAGFAGDFTLFGVGLAGTLTFN